MSRDPFVVKIEQELMEKYPLGPATNELHMLTGGMVARLRVEFRAWAKDPKLWLLAAYEVQGWGNK